MDTRGRLLCNTYYVYCSNARDSKTIGTAYVTLREQLKTFSTTNDPGKYENRVTSELRQV